MVVLDELELWQFVVLRMALGQEDDINEMEKRVRKGFFFLQCLQTEDCESLVMDCLLVIWSLKEGDTRIMNGSISVAKKVQGRE